MRRARLVEDQRDTLGVRVWQIRQPQCFGVVDDVLALADRPAAIGRDLRQRRPVLRASVRSWSVDEGDPVLLPGRARIGGAGSKLVEQRATLRQGDGVETLDLGGVPGADGLVEAAGGLRLQLRRLGRRDVPLGRGPGVGTGVVGNAAAHHQSGGLLTRAELVAGDERRRWDRLPPQVRARSGDGHPRRSPQLVGEQEVVVAGEQGELVGVDP